MSPRLFVAALAAVLLIPSVAVRTALAAEGDTECAGFGFDPTAPIAVYEVTQAQKQLNFVKSRSEGPSCPSNATACRMRAYIMPADVVVVAANRNGFACAGYRGLKGGYTFGWLPAAGLQELTPISNPTAADWVGNWQRAEATIAIKSAPKGQIAISAEGTYGAFVKEMVARGNVRSGTFAATIKPTGDRLTFTDGDEGKATFAADGSCRVRMWLVQATRGKRLIVEDDTQCGGMGMSFTGVYEAK